MPRANKTRKIFAEDHVAGRVIAERDARGWTNDGLATRMTDAGCPMTGSAIFKIEKGSPRRRIVVDEFVAFSRVFGVETTDMLLPPEVAQQQVLQTFLTRLGDDRIKAAEALGRVATTQAELAAYASKHTEAAEALGRLSEHPLMDWLQADDESLREIAKTRRVLADLMDQARARRPEAGAGRG